eukprot:XP_024306041.1 uncharacterized protein C16orf97 isoform X1 [Homo sapiens]
MTSVTPLCRSLLPFGQQPTSEANLVSGEAFFPHGKGKDGAEPVCLCVPWTTPFQCKILMVEFIVGFYDFCLALEVQYRTSKLFLCGQPSPRRSLGIQQQALKLACLSPTLLESSSCVDPPGNTAGSRMPSSSNCIK